MISLINMNTYNAMRRLGIRLLPAVAALAGVAAMAGGCNSVVDDRIPAVPVTINLSDAGRWNTYGVSGFGIYRYFIRPLHEPSNFPYTDQTYTGFGGVLLIGGMDPFTADTQVPLAYDLACPVECRTDVRVRIDENKYEAVCDVCGSRYDVTMAGGSPVSGPAADGNNKYGLQRYRCEPTALGGYIITR